MHNYIKVVIVVDTWCAYTPIYSIINNSKSKALKVKAKKTFQTVQTVKSFAKTSKESQKKKKADLWPYPDKKIKTFFFMAKTSTTKNFFKKNSIWVFCEGDGN